MNTEPQFNEEIVINKIACPLHVIALKQGLDVINEDEVLKVITETKNLSQELTSACMAMDHTVKAIEENTKTILYVKKTAYK